MQTRMRHVHFMAVVLIVGLAAAVHAFAIDASKRVEEIVVRPVVPSSFAAMYAQSAKVLVVTVAARHSETFGDESRPHVRTRYRANVLTVWKGHTDSSVTFTQSAGEVELPDRILRIVGRTALNVGDRYVVFLQESNGTQPLVLIGSDEGAFRVHDGLVDPVGHGRIADEQRNLSENKFIGELTRLARRDPHRN